MLSGSMNTRGTLSPSASAAGLPSSQRWTGRCRPPYVMIQHALATNGCEDGSAAFPSFDGSLFDQILWLLTASYNPTHPPPLLGLVVSLAKPSMCWMRCLAINVRFYVCCSAVRPREAASLCPEHGCCPVRGWSREPGSAA